MPKPKKPSEPLLSEQISCFLNLLNQSIKDYNYNLLEEQKLEQLTQDYLHKIELEEVKYKDRAKIATKMKYIRKQRRIHKDSIAILGPIVTFVESSKGQNLKNLLNEVLGQTRKAERTLGDRCYYFRVLKEPPIQTNKDNQSN